MNFHDSKSLKIKQIYFISKWLTVRHHDHCLFIIVTKLVDVQGSWSWISKDLCQFRNDCLSAILVCVFVFSHFVLEISEGLDYDCVSAILVCVLEISLKVLNFCIFLFSVILCWRSLTVLSTLMVSTGNWPCVCYWPGSLYWSVWSEVYRVLERYVTNIITTERNIKSNTIRFLKSEHKLIQFTKICNWEVWI